MIDCHAHLFHPKVIANVKKRSALVQRIRLNTEGADQRVGAGPLEQALHRNRFHACLVLPTALPHEVSRVNDALFKTLRASPLLYPAGTLHPDYHANPAELQKLRERDQRGIKLCSFSQRFSLEASPTLAMFELIQRVNVNEGGAFFVVLDTFASAHQFMGSPPEFTTTPGLLGQLVRLFPGLKFIAAHMGGLSADYTDIVNQLLPLENLYLDTSNAAHVLTENQFVSLLKRHGPENVVFGTDWPWFTHATEVGIISGLLKQAGFNEKQRQLVFTANMAGLMGIQPQHTRGAEHRTTDRTTPERSS